jgi:hypothetical protein
LPFSNPSDRSNLRFVTKLISRFLSYKNLGNHFGSLKIFKFGYDIFSNKLRIEMESKMEKFKVNFVMVVASRRPY